MGYMMIYFVGNLSHSDFHPETGEIEGGQSGHENTANETSETARVKLHRLLVRLKIIIILLNMRLKIPWTFI